MLTHLHFIDNLQAGGKERQCVELVKGLTAQDDTRCIVVTMTEGLFFTELMELPRVHVEHLVRKTRHDPIVVWRFLQLCRRWRPDVITAWHAMPAIYAIPSARLLGIPLLSAFIQDAPANDISHMLRYRTAFRFSDAIVANSHAGVRAYRPPPSKTRVIRSGFDFQRLSRKPDGDWLRRHYDIRAPFIVGMVATFSEFKDQPTLIRAAEIVLRQRRDVAFVFVGGGPTLELCRALVPPALEAYIQFVGRVEAPIEQVIGAFDIGALATFTEGISNSLVECMAQSIPVIATDCEGNTEVVQDGTSGILVPPRDPHAFAGAIMRLLDDAPLRAQMGQRGREIVDMEFRMDRVTEQFRNLSRTLITRRRVSYN